MNSDRKELRTWKPEVSKERMIRFIPSLPVPSTYYNLGVLASQWEWDKAMKRFKETKCPLKAAMDKTMTHAPMILKDGVPFSLGMTIWAGPHSVPLEVKTSADTHEVHSFSEVDTKDPDVIKTRHFLVPKGFPRLDDAFLYNKHIGTVRCLAYQYSTKANLIREGVRQRVSGMGIALSALAKTFERHGEPAEGTLALLKEIDALYFKLAPKVGLQIKRGILSSETKTED